MLKRFFKWRMDKSVDEISDKSLLLRAFITTVEDLLLWKNSVLSVGFILILNVFFFIILQIDIRFLEFIFGTTAFILSIDAFEAWLKYKRRTACLKRLSRSDGQRLQKNAAAGLRWIRMRSEDFFMLREQNPTKAFLLANIALGSLFVVGKTLSGVLFLYLLLMTVALLPVTFPHFMKCVNKIQQHAESDAEIESLIPEPSEQDMKDLNIETDSAIVARKSTVPDYWLPEDIPPGENSDSSDNSNSLVTNLSAERSHTLENDVDSSSDSSEDDYLPETLPEERFQSSVEVVPAVSNTWSNSAITALWSLSSAVSSMITTSSTNLENKRKRVSSADSSDGFEFIDQNDVL